MITKADVFSVAKSLARAFVLPALLKSTAFAVLGAAVFFVAGLLVYNFGPGLLLTNTHVVVRLFVALLVLGVYTALGVLAGLTLGAASAVSKQLPAAEQGVHQMLTPLMGGIVEKIPVGQVGIPVERFNSIVDGKIAELIRAPENRSGLFSALNFVARLVMQRLLGIARAVLVVNFVQDLQASGETQVTVQALEKFGREKLMRLVTNYARVKLSAFRKIAWAASGVLMFVPVTLVVLKALRG